MPLWVHGPGKAAIGQGIVSVWCLLFWACAVCVGMYCQQSVVQILDQPGNGSM